MNGLKIGCLATVAVALLVGANPAQSNATTTITFEGFSNAIFGDEVVSNGLEVGSYAGYNFTSSGDHFHFIDSTAFSTLPNNGTGILSEDRDYSITMTEATGASFDLLSASYAGNNDNGSAATSLSVTGFYTGGGSATTTIALSGTTWASGSFSGFTGLSRVVFDGIGGGGGFALDNITVATVPEPSTYLLCASAALVLLGSVNRPRRVSCAR